MNIFYLSENIDECAKFHCDKHVLKMSIEYVQILSSAHHVLDGEHSPISSEIYKLTHKNHPCCKWVRESIENYYYLLELSIKIHEEYTHRYEKIHKSSEKIIFLLDYPKNIPFLSKTRFPLCMPDDYKIGGPVESYRNYYKKDKKRFANYTKRCYPEWLI